MDGSTLMEAVLFDPDLLVLADLPARALVCLRLASRRWTAALICEVARECIRDRLVRAAVPLRMHRACPEAIPAQGRPHLMPRQGVFLLTLHG